MVSKIFIIFIDNYIQTTLTHY